MKFIDLLTRVKVVTLDTPFTNLILEIYVENKDEDNIKAILNYYLSL